MNAQSPRSFLGKALAADWLAILAALFCFGFGAVSLAYVLGPADGTWMLYSQELMAGKRLYSDLDFNQQPLFPLLALLSLKLSAGGIISSRWLFLLIMAGFVTAVVRLCRLARVNPLIRAVLIIAVFFTSIRFEAFRFDDYHGLSALLYFSSLLVAIALQQGSLSVRRYALLQAVICTATVLTRPNDGAAIILAACFVAVLRKGLTREVLLAALWAAAAAVALLLLTLLCLRETPQVWFVESVVEASGAKGGGGSLLGYPLQLYLNSFHDMLAKFALPFRWLIVASLISGGFAAHLARRGSQWSRIVTVFACVVFAVLILLSGWQVSIEHITPITLLGATAACLTALILAIFRAARSAGAAPQRLDFALLVYPVMLFIFGSLSSGGTYYSLYPPAAMTLALFTVIATQGGSPAKGNLLASGLLLILFSAIACEGVSYRTANPYRWLDYRVPALGGDYLLRDDRNGLHYIPAELAAMIDPVCARIRPGQSLLSAPWPFANSYCRIAPWHGYVQTFFDTTTAPHVEALISDLQKAPPDFIYYQQQSIVMRNHEVIYHHGAPVAQRRLEELILGNVAAGKWRIVAESHTYAPSVFYLIETRPQ